MQFTMMKRPKPDPREWRPWFAWFPVDVTDRYPDAKDGAASYRDDVAPPVWVWLETVERRMIQGSMFPFWVHRPVGEARGY